MLSFPAVLWSLGRRVEELLALQRTTREALEVVNSRLRALEDRMVYLEANQDKLVGEALGGKRGFNGGRGSGDL